ncbi:hypothetical protein GCM10025734_78970 [Kitasatospora paranensis]
MHVGIAGEVLECGGVRPLDGGLCGGEARRVDGEAARVVVRVLGQAAGAEGRDVADGLALDQHTDRVDQHECADPPVGVPQGRLHADPAADGRPDDDGPARVVGGEQAEVGVGEVRHGADGRRAVGAVPAGVGRGDGAHAAGQVAGEAVDRPGAAAAVQDERRAPGARFGEVDVEAGAEAAGPGGRVLSAGGRIRCAGGRGHGAAAFRSEGAAGGPRLPEYRNYTCVYTQA